VRKLFLALVLAFVLAVAGTALITVRCHHAACVAADKYMSTATDGPWVQSKTRLRWYFRDDITLPPEPRLVFRFHNPEKGGDSKRIYVSFSGDRAWSYGIVLDPMPLFGSPP
jgi:hypothetical protein